MKKLLALFALILAVSPLSAHAGSRVITTLLMNVDSDGKEDLLRVVETARPGHPEITDRAFEVVFAKTGQREVFRGLLQPVTYQPKDKTNPCHSGIEDNKEELLVGTDVYVSLRRTGESSFVVTEEYDDNGCSYYGKREFQATLNEPGFTLDRAHRTVGHHGMGSGYYSRADFDFTSLSGKEELMDRNGGDDENGTHEWSIPKTCKPLLKQISKQKLPACAEYKKR